MKSCYDENDIALILNELRSGYSVNELCSRYEISDATLYTWNKKYSNMDSNGIRQMRGVENVMSKLKREKSLVTKDNIALKEFMLKK
ncbi:hypothetical protein A9Q81_13570 [Gammaproteobacteria bacterium 42_54_T18]|nr:hypothetical protein A9Q81_13570 [Gammaproteobacteria bacterium 42_54_T18]